MSDDFVNELLGEEEVLSPETPSLPVRVPPSSPASLARRVVGRGLSTRPTLKKLSQRHKLIIGLHLSGKATKEIAKVIGCSQAIVTGVIRDPLAQEVIMFYYEGVEDELKALFPLVVGTVRDALTAGAMDTRLKGVDRFTKLSGLDNREGGEKGVTINIIQDARRKFVQEIREASKEVIEVEVVKCPTM